MNMSLLDDLVKAYTKTDLPKKCQEVGIKANLINAINWPQLKEASLAQWLYNSLDGTSELAIKGNNFANLPYRPAMVGFADKISAKIDPSELSNTDFCKFGNVDKFITGYWKFLTREPYQGLEGNTSSPETFLGFIARNGFSADPGYVKKIVNLMPKARDLLVKASGGTVVMPIAKLAVISAPKIVEVGVSFKLDGTAKEADLGQNLTVNLDDKLFPSSVAIGNDGKWQFNGVFSQIGDRTITITSGTEKVIVNIRAMAPVTLASKLTITNSVGVGGTNNPADVRIVKARLSELGYIWVGDINDGKMQTGTTLAIKLFQSIVYGASTVSGADGRIDLNGFTFSWLKASNAPRWITMPPSDKSISLYNYEQEDTNDDHDFGTDWLATALRGIAKSYHNTFRASNPTAAPLAINDVSRPQGGDTPDHSGHETGLMCDLMLPQKGGKVGGITFRSKEYDQRTAKAMIVAIKNYFLVRKVLFNDPDLIREGWCNPAPAHDDHIHFEINPPPRQ
jgi:Mannosyl-glycoprotein endo-beta-N-acetylglucosaminidase